MPLSLAGWGLGIVYLFFSKVAKRLWARSGRWRRLLPLAGGIALGASMAFLPHVGLPGSDAFSYQLLGEWEQLIPLTLVATAIVRTVLIAFLLNIGWSGGPFLPLAYCAICLGFGIAGATGMEPGLCIAAIAAGVLVTFSGQPLMGIAALMCCPVEGIPVILVACLISAIIPKPRGLRGDFGKRSSRK